MYSYKDISVGQGPRSGWFPSATIDPINNKLLVSTTNMFDLHLNRRTEFLFRCNLDGTDCTHTDLTAAAGQTPGNTTYSSSILVDPFNRKILVISPYPPGLFAVALTKCDLDVSNCSRHALRASNSNNELKTGLDPRAVIDEINRKLLIAFTSSTDSTPDAESTLSLFRCDLDGTNCTANVISSVASSGTNPSITINPANNMLYIATDNRNTTNPTTIGKLSVFRCNLDGTGCSHTDVSTATGAGGSSGGYPSLAFDMTNQRLSVVTMNANNSNRLSLFQCDRSVENCRHTDVSTATGAGLNSGLTPSLVIDPENQMLRIATWNRGNSGKLSMFFCGLAGDHCEHIDASTAAGVGNNTGHWPSMVITPGPSRDLRIVTCDTSREDRPALFNADWVVTPLNQNKNDLLSGKN